MYGKRFAHDMSRRFKRKRRVDIGVPLSRQYKRYVRTKYGRQARQAFKSRVANLSNFRSARNNTGFARRRKAYRKTYRGRRVAPSVKAYVKRVAAQDQPTNSKRDLSSGTISVEANECSYTSFTMLAASEIEGAIGTSTQLEDDAGGLLDVDLAGGVNTFTKKTRILNCLHKYDFRNNGQIPVNLECYWVTYKYRGASSETPITNFNLGMADRGITSGADTDIRFNLYDSPMFKKHHKIIKYQKHRLNGGDEVTLFLKRNKAFVYDPAELDGHTSSARMRGRTQCLVIRMTGVVAHDDTTTTAVGTGNGTIDWVKFSHIKWESDPDTKFRHLQTGSGTLGTLTTPVVDGPTIETDMQEEL